MGRFMTLKPKGNQSVTMSKAEINEFNRKIKKAEEDLKIEMIDHTAILFCAYVLEEQPIDADADKIADMYERINWWAENINDPTVRFRIEDVIKIIEDKTGREISWQ